MNSQDYRKEWYLSESIVMAVLLAFVGGFLDAYTYIARGHVFCNAQTGNLVLMAMAFGEGKMIRGLGYMFPVMAFVVGVFLADYSKERWGHSTKFHWRQIVIGVELALLIIAGFVPCGELNIFVNILISFVCALQMESFRSFHGNPFTSTVCTGNLRSGTHALFSGLIGHKAEHVTLAASYYRIILFFILGSIFGTLFTKWLMEKGILVAAFILAGLMALMFKERLT